MGELPEGLRADAPADIYIGDRVERTAGVLHYPHASTGQAGSQILRHQSGVVYLLEYYSEELPEGTYPFSIYAWSYVGLNPMFRVVPICENELLAAELTDILQDADTSTTSITVDKGTWAGLEGMHIALWQREKRRISPESRALQTIR